MRRLARSLIVTGVALAFLYALAGILLTGPIVVTPPEVTLRIEPDAERLRQSVATLCGELAPRDYRHPDSLARTAEWIAARLGESGLPVELQEYTLREGRFRNVIAVRRGSDPSAGAVVVGAHYDAYGGFPGADDNASGVAVLLELVRTLPTWVPRETQYFVAFDAEEPPFFGTGDMGSARFARLLLERGVDVQLMVALDMVGYYSDEPGSQRFPLPVLRLFYPSRGNFLAVVGDTRSGRWIQRVKSAILATRALPVESFRAPRWVAGVDWSDHASFRDVGLPGVLVTDTAYQRYAHYHAPTDTPERLDYARMARVVLGLHGVLREPEPDD
ncbi:MAG TPA: M28 family peptidase [Candidatus Polarisedimenticolaceae bacterium]|nr:M28 family peptidase [Candidatus Polarisedimenticolaceae bacterium]